MSDLNLPNVPEGYFWVVESENPDRLNAKCYVRLKRRTFFGLFNKTVGSSGFFISRRGLPAYPALDGLTSESAILNKATNIYRECFGGSGPSVANYTGTYYTDM